tara:strand:- start:303 stop:788 length:486 start_codon:yes stop_codon:yes gene_type:complete
MKTLNGFTDFLTIMLGLTIASVLTGCSPYRLQGVVIEGAVSHMQIVEKDDPRLTQGNGMPMASIEVSLDPDRLSRKDLQRALSDIDGTFSVPVDEPGAGFLEYDARVIVRRTGYNTATQDIRLPGPDQRLLVTLVNGEDTYKPEPQDLMDETLEMGEPYMQ